MRFLFILATFVGSFALFLLEPMVAKALLPSFGGSSLVWNGCLLFFQAALLAGYAYANFLTSRATLGRAKPIHLALVAIALVLTGILFAPVNLWKIHPAPEANPLYALLITLLLTTAAPFVLLAAGTPLIQRWFAHSDDPQAHDPYFLYAASNLGSFFGLIAYPVLIEPKLTLAGQRFLVLGLFAAYAVVLVLASSKVKEKAVASAQPTTPEVPPQRITAAARAKWAMLSAAPSALLLAVTTDLTKNIAPIPLLWVLPLGLYLLTFVIVFSGHARRLEAGGGAPIWVRMGLAFALIGQVYIMLVSPLPIDVAVKWAIFAFFATALACHLQLARLRPAASQLTEYYLWISIGGVLGGLFCALLAPLIFTGNTELPIALGACVLLYAFVQPAKKLEALDIALTLIGLVTIVYIGHRCNLIFVNPNAKPLPAEVATKFVGAILVLCAMWPRSFAVAFAGYLAVFAFGDRHAGETTLFAARNYYGYEAVTLDSSKTIKSLINGNILHGVQFADSTLRREPTTYYAKGGPLGEALLPTLDSHPGARIAAVGLGSGTEAAYGRTGMSIDFYELNPAIERIARDPKFFTYLSDSRAAIKVILGDARLSLVDAPNGSYDAIILDAFSSDSIPIHLITSEAMALYRSKLKPDGLLLVHASNQFLTLSTVVAASGATAGFVCDRAIGPAAQNSWLRSATTWLALATSRTRLTQIEGPGSDWEEFVAAKGTKPWTDDYSNVFGALKAVSPEPDVK